MSGKPVFCCGPRLLLQEKTKQKEEEWVARYTHVDILSMNDLLWGPVDLRSGPRYGPVVPVASRPGRTALASDWQL